MIQNGILVALITHGEGDDRLTATGGTSRIWHRYMWRTCCVTNGQGFSLTPRSHLVLFYSSTLHQLSGLERSNTSRSASPTLTPQLLAPENPHCSRWLRANEPNVEYASTVGRPPQVDALSAKDRNHHKRIRFAACRSGLVDALGFWHIIPTLGRRHQRARICLRRPQ